ncbi:hypothetical protein D041_3947A, partial [Vibrio parahaemolyticus EKP-008]
MLVMY